METERILMLISHYFAGVENQINVIKEYLPDEGKSAINYMQQETRDRIKQDYDVIFRSQGGIDERQSTD